MKEKIVRFGVAVPENILREFDRRIKQSGKTNRSDAIRHLIRHYIADERWQEDDGDVYGTVTMMYDHHGTGISKDLTSLQHDHGDIIVCTTHVHATHETCLECIVLRGSASRIRGFVDDLGLMKGLKSMDTVISAGI